MHNQLGTESQTSLLHVSPSVPGSNGSNQNGIFGANPTTGIVIVAVVCCVIFVSLVWAFVIYKTRRSRNSPNHPVGEASGGGMERGLGGTPGWNNGSSQHPHCLPNRMDISGLPGEGEFDIHEHVRKGIIIIIFISF